MAEFRIVRDRFCGYEVQIRRWWWPFWVQAGWVNSHTSIEKAEEWARGYSQRFVVKRLGRLSTKPLDNSRARA
jgi:hypothetical protein